MSAERIIAKCKLSESRDLASARGQANCKTAICNSQFAFCNFPARQDPWYVRWTLIGLAITVLGVLVIVPVANVFVQALGHGVGAYVDNLLHDDETWHAIRLTLTIAPLAVALNVVFGIAAAWSITRFRFRGRTLLTALIDLPFAVSPIVAGLMLVLLFGRQGHLGPWLSGHSIKIIFALPGLVLATTFVTLPFVARELIPVMEALGSDEEVAAVSLGASGWQTFWRITLPNIKWGLLYGVILCNARAMGEFGAVYVVSGRIAGQTDTMPLRVEKLFQEYNNPGSFAVASVLTSLALVTLVVKVILERKTRLDLQQAQAAAPLQDAA
jgi:sulfate transport system permease protein